MECKKRERSANFTNAECQLLVSLVEKYKLVVENKKTDAVTNKDKEAAWRKIETSFNSCGVSSSARSWKTLKLKYEGIKKGTKKKSSLQRQDLYRTGGGPSNAPTFSDIEEKVLCITSNITGLEARHDSDAISITIPDSKDVWDGFNISVGTQEQLETENDEVTETTEEAHVQIPDLNESIIFEYAEENDSKKENKWDRWHPKALKTRVSSVLKSDTANKASVTSKLDKLSEARLELVHLQMETARKEQQYMEEQHRVKMEHLNNDEKRKDELHALLIQKISCGSIPNNILKIDN